MSVSYNKMCSDCDNWIEDIGHTGQCGVFNDYAMQNDMPCPAIPDWFDASKCKRFSATEEYIALCADHDELSKMEPCQWNTN